jgi:hypothetical protein
LTLDLAFSPVIFSSTRMVLSKLAAAAPWKKPWVTVKNMSSQQWRMKPLRMFWRRPKAPARKIQFFVVGTGRCGTTLLRDILRLHPTVYVPSSESHWIPYQHELCASLRHPATFHAGIIERFSFPNGELMVDVMAADVGMSREDLFTATRAALAQEASTVVEWNDALFHVLAAASGRSVIGDKTPCYCLHMPLLQELWPGARFIHIIRDGRDVAFSMSQHIGFRIMASLASTSWIPLALDRRYAVGEQPNPEPALEDYLGLWAFRLRRALDDAKRLAPGSYIEIRYENLVNAPRAEVSRLARFLGVAQPQDWLTRVEELTRGGSTNRIRHQAEWEALTAVSQEILTELDYPTGERWSAGFEPPRPNKAIHTLD